MLKAQEDKWLTSYAKYLRDYAIPQETVNIFSRGKKTPEILMAVVSILFNYNLPENDLSNIDKKWYPVSIYNHEGRWLMQKDDEFMIIPKIDKKTTRFFEQKSARGKETYELSFRKDWHGIVFKIR